MLKDYKELHVWKKAYALVLDIYKLTNLYPKTEIYGLTSQIRKSAISIPSNIAEGYCRQHKAEYVQFLSIALGSLSELETQIMLSKDLRFISEQQFNEIYQKIYEIFRMLRCLISSLKEPSNKIKNVVVLILFLLSSTLYPLPSTLLFADAGKSGGQFLRIIQSPRAVGMGESGTGLYGDLLSSIALNPASLSRTGYKEVSFTYNKWFEDISMQQIAYAYPLGRKGVFAGSVAMLQMSAFDGYNNSGGYVGNVHASDMLASVGYARRISGLWNDLRYGWFVGGSIKYARENLDDVIAQTVLFDAGVLYLSVIKNSVLGFGLSAQSLGNGFKFDLDTDKPPTVYRAGISYITYLWGDLLSIAIDLKKPSDDKFMFSGGLEFLLKRIIAWRIGYIPDIDMGNGFRFGTGFELKLVKLDYALSNYGKFGTTHRFSVSYKFGKPIEMTPYLTPVQEKARWRLEKGRQLFNQGRYYESVLEFNEALQLEPNLKEALQLMKRARVLMETER